MNDKLDKAIKRVGNLISQSKDWLKEVSNEEGLSIGYSQLITREEIKLDELEEWRAWLVELKQLRANQYQIAIDALYQVIYLITPEDNSLDIRQRIVRKINELKETSE